MDVGIRIKATDEASGVFGKVGAEAGKLGSAVSQAESGFTAFGNTAGASLGKVEMSAKATAAAMRQVPAQFTDIITSLQGGQKPLTVLLQQGGQLKDMFGGVGNATKALGTYVASLVNPFTAAAGAVGVLGYAYLQGQKESQEYQRVLIETGNAAGTTSVRLAASASNVANHYKITQGAAAGALSAFASTNTVAAASFEKFSGLAVKWSEVTGRAVGDTVKIAEELGKSPVEASIKYNEATHHLTASIYEQIKALSEQGKTAEAGALAQKAYFDAMNDRLPALAANLGLLERSWSAIGRVAKGAWDEMLNVGRPTNPLSAANTALETAELALSKARDRAASGGVLGERSGNESKQLAQIEKIVAARRDDVAYAQEVQKLTDKIAARAKQSADEATGRIELDKIHDQYLSKEVQMQQQIAKAQEAYRNSPKEAGDAKKLKESIAGIREQYAGEGPASALASQIRELEDQQAAAVASGDRSAKAIAAQHAAQLIDDATFYAQKRDAALKANIDQQAVVELEVAAVAKSGVKSAEKTAQLQRYNSDLKKLREQALGIEGEYQNGLVAMAAKERKIQDDYIAGLGKAGATEAKRLADAVLAQTQHNAEIGKTKEQIEDYKRSVESTATAEKEAQASAIEALLERNATLLEYGDTLGLIGNQAKDIYEEELKNLKEQIAQRKKLVALYSEGAIKEKAAAAATATAAEWKRGWEETDRLGREVFTTWATDGSNAAQKIGDTLKKALLSAIYEATLKPLAFQLYTSIAGGAPGGGTGGVGGITGMVNTASNLNSLYGAGKQFLYGGTAGASNASLLYANGTQAVGGDGLGALIQGNGGWAGVSTGSNLSTTAAMTEDAWFGSEAVASGAGTASGTAATSEIMAAGSSAGPIGLMVAAVIAILASRDATRVSSTGDSTSQFDASGKVINRTNQLFGGDKPIVIPTIVNGVAVANPAKPSDYRGFDPTSVPDGMTREIWDANNATGDAHFNQLVSKSDKYVESLNAAYLAAAKNLGVGAVGTNFTYGSNDSSGGKFRLGVSAGDSRFDSGDTALTDGELKLAASRAILTALEGSDLPKYMQGVFDGVDAAQLDQAGIDAAIKSATDLKTAYQTLALIPDVDLTNISFDTLNALKQDAQALATVDIAASRFGYTMLDVSAQGGAAAQALVAAFGDLANFQAQTSSYFQNYFTQDEQNAATYSTVQSDLKKVGLDYTIEQIKAATRSDIRAVADQAHFAIGTTAGDAQYAAVIKAANLLAPLTKSLDVIATTGQAAVGNSGGGGGGGAPVQDAALTAWQDATDAIVDVMSDLRTTLVDSGPDSFSKLQAQFAIEVASAKAGNLTAAQDLPDLVKTLANASKDEFTTSVQRDLFVARLIETLGDVVGAGSAGGNLTNPNFVGGAPQVPAPVVASVPRSYDFVVPTPSGEPALGNDATVLEELRAVKAELQAIRASSGSTAVNTGKVAKAIDASANGGQPLGVKVL